MSSKCVRKRRRIDQSIKSYFLPQCIEDPLAPRVRKLSQQAIVKEDLTIDKKISTKICRKALSKSSINIKKSSQSTGQGVSKQLYLDFGQKSFGKRTICPICNMMYVHGVKEDEIEHEKVCSEYKFGVPFPSWKNERLIQKYSNGDKIVEVRSSDPLRHTMKIKQVKSIIDNDMSFAPTKTPPSLTFYLYISPRKKIIGFLSAHPLSIAFPLISNETNMRSQTKRSANLGIYQIWTLKSSRRKGIANKLVDTARKKLLYGMQVDKSKVAFSSPTGEGITFAKSYIDDKNEVLVYDC